jgi:hypothetical protein
LPPSLNRLADGGEFGQFLKKKSLHMAANVCKGQTGIWKIFFKSADIQIPRVCFKSDQPNVSGNTWEQWRRRWETRHKE